eukprot:CAMPEP_0181182250 /NCGR_PEP_ID=MMETSP1096-20121128/7786_1 /TAXON_ID=156174 ORGANISM="Chrysochromulina ericina, Strain CCMP281" /NCGR_SAMPLE_ID=MMETSP1096 /ASSEMBLY_ACC=CAM_ASM_000453 /LENGTH=32 /DNA_ID= /DNA_START= /DNA_END= /DNA_ORIENTATION=
MARGMHLKAGIVTGAVPLPDVRTSAPCASRAP